MVLLFLKQTYKYDSCAFFAKKANDNMIICAKLQKFLCFSMMFYISFAFIYYYQQQRSVKNYLYLQQRWQKLFSLVVKIARLLCLLVELAKMITNNSRNDRMISTNSETGKIPTNSGPQIYCKFSRYCGILLTRNLETSQIHLLHICVNSIAMFQSSYLYNVHKPKL